MCINSNANNTKPKPLYILIMVMVLAFGNLNIFEENIDNNIMHNDL